MHGIIDSCDMQLLTTAFVLFQHQQQRRWWSQTLRCSSETARKSTLPRDFTVHAKVLRLALHLS